MVISLTVNESFPFIFSKKLKDCDIIEINPAQGRILFPLWQEDKISIQELAQKTALEKSTLTRMLDALEESGQVVRVFSKEDRRKVLIELTESNKKMKSSYEQVSEDMTELFYKGFTNKEIEEFEEYLKRIYENLSNHQSK
jgi:DNA-binding MarR family transcriptional regulator